MEDIKVISGDTEQDIWPVIDADLATEDVLDYNVLIKQAGKEIQLCIDIDPGGGFEGGWELTWFKAVLNTNGDFKFAVHDEHFADEIGKFFGMQDVETGYPELDKHIVIKTSDEQKIKSIFTDADIRQLFTELESFDCGVHEHNERYYLELNIEEGITDAAELKKIYHAFYKLLGALETPAL